MTIVEMGKRAKDASRVLATAGASLKTKALCALADALEENCDYIRRLPRVFTGVVMKLNTSVNICTNCT